MTITEVSKEYGLSAETLRYYERIGIIPTVNRAPGGNRDYTEDDCGWVGFSKCMRNAGLPVESLIEYVALFTQGDATIGARKQILIEQLDILSTKLEEMQKLQEHLKFKIENYEQMFLPAEQKLKTKKTKGEKI